MRGYPPAIFQVTNAPSAIPTTKKRFHDSFFQSYLKKEIFAGKHAAHTCRSVDEIPKGLLPSSRSKGTIRPIRGPEKYHGHGSLIKENMIFSWIYFLKKEILIQCTGRK